jgi:hypothetical protein
MSRIMKRALPANAKTSKDGKEMVQECSRAPLRGPWLHHLLKKIAMDTTCSTKCPNGVIDM